MLTLSAGSDPAGAYNGQRRKRKRPPRGARCGNAASRSRLGSRNLAGASCQQIGALLLLLASAATARGQADFLSSAELHQAGLVKSWQLQLPLAAGQQVADSYLVDDQIYVTTQDGFVYAVDAATGALRWLNRVTRGGYRILRPCHAGERVIFITPAELTQFGRYDGGPIRQFLFRFPAGSPPVSDGTFFYVGGINRRVYAFPLDWEFEAWKAGAAGQVLGQPALFGGHLFFASEGGDIYSCVAGNKQREWAVQVRGSVTADLVVDDNGVYVACRDRSLYLFDSATGGRRWRARLSSPLYEPPFATPDVAYQFSADDGLVAIHTGAVPSEARIRWRLPEGRMALAVDPRFVYVLSRDQKLLVVRSADGKVQHSVAATGFALGMPSPGGSGIFLASTDGRLFCARQRGAALVAARDVRRALGQAAPLAEPAAAPSAVASAPAAPPAAARAPAGAQLVRRAIIGGKSKVTKQFLSGQPAAP